jgi:hypothetical protein
LPGGARRHREIAPPRSGRARRRTDWPFDQRARFLPDETTAVSIADRILHHGVVVTEGQSFRLREARAGGGVRLQKQ